MHRLKHQVDILYILGHPPLALWSNLQIYNVIVFHNHKKGLSRDHELIKNIISSSFLNTYNGRFIIYAMLFYVSGGIRSSVSKELMGLVSV